MSFLRLIQWNFTTNCSICTLTPIMKRPREIHGTLRSTTEENGTKNYFLENEQSEKKGGGWGALVLNCTKCNLCMTLSKLLHSTCADAASFNCAGCFTWATQTREKTDVLIELYGTTVQSVRLMPEKKSAGMWISSRASAPWDECRADPSSTCTRHLYTQCCALTQFMHIVYCQGHSILVWGHIIPS